MTHDIPDTTPTDSGVVTLDYAETIAALPYLLGRAPEHDLIVIPRSLDQQPMARIDLDLPDLAAAARRARPPGSPPAEVFLIAHTDRDPSAGRAALNRARMVLGPPVAARILTDGRTWHDLDRGVHGVITAAHHQRVAGIFAASARYLRDGSLT